MLVRVSAAAKLSRGSAMGSNWGVPMFLIIEIFFFYAIKINSFNPVIPIF